MASASWSVRDLPDLSGKTAVVTGANSGLGYETTVALAGAGAHVVMACRSAEKAAEARRGAEAAHPNASLELRALDLANLASVRDFAKSFLDAHERLAVGRGQRQGATLGPSFYDDLEGADEPLEPRRGGRVLQRGWGKSEWCGGLVAHLSDLRR